MNKNFQFLSQNDLFEWCRDHRVHHKFSETDADPHNSNRGFFFAHVGWLLTKKHPDVILKGKQIDCSDLMNDPVIRIQKRYRISESTEFTESVFHNNMRGFNFEYSHVFCRFYILFYLVFCFLLPTLIPVYFWSETWINSFLVAGMWR